MRSTREKGRASPSKRKEKKIKYVKYSRYRLHEASPPKRKEKSKENKVCTVFNDKDCIKQVLQKEKRKENNVFTVIYDSDCPIDFTHSLFIINLHYVFYEINFDF